MSIVKGFRIFMLLWCVSIAACSGNAEPPAATQPPTTEPTNVTESESTAEVTAEIIEQGTEAAAPENNSAPATPTAEIAAQAVAVAATATQVNAEGQPVNAEGVPLVARVNGIEITQAEFEQALARSQLQFEAADMQALQESVLNSLIEQAVIEQAAAEQQLSVTDEEVETEYQLNRELVPDDAAWQQWLGDNQYTEADFRQSLRDALITGKMRDAMTQDMPENVMQVHARHILVATEAEANQILERLNNGEEFAALAASLSQDVTTREQGGDLGWFIDGELWEPALSQAAFSLEPGQIAGPVPTRLGYHVVQTLERGERPLPEEKRFLLAQITFERWLQGALYSAEIERFGA